MYSETLREETFPYLVLQEFDVQRSVNRNTRVLIKELKIEKDWKWHAKASIRWNNFGDLLTLLINVCPLAKKLDYTPIVCTIL